MDQKLKPHYTVSVYSEIDSSLLESHYYTTEVEARVAKVKLDAKYAEELCRVEIETVYEE